MKDKFLLHPDINYLNHGSFGACPKVVFEDYIDVEGLIPGIYILYMTDEASGSKAARQFVKQ